MTEKKNAPKPKQKLEKAPVYEILGWVTEQQAADQKTTKDKPIARTTISRWRSGGFINCIDINESLIVVPNTQLMKFDGVPMGGHLPPTVDELPDEIELVLRRVIDAKETEGKED